MLGFPTFDERRLVDDVEESVGPNPVVADASVVPETTTIAIRPPSSLLQFARRMGLNATLKELEALTAHAQVRGITDWGRGPWVARTANSIIAHCLWICPLETAPSSTPAC